ncbi:uncharacterized protein LOC114278241 isoform X1 [Camellia sinensis]|uniref:uncharacterized protein LOC114278241 isoform X1 n=1 Tax=Camellia sinensis TaxID=4442 RepID=UPI0010367A3D|nr:uncharacterized protein LOC114278241 isoform X1 [Camellia sinensis]
MELDETRIRNAAHLMVASLAGSLTHVTSKEPLCGSISSQLMNSLQGLNIASELEQAVQLVTNDNLDLGCALIEQAATENVRLLSIFFHKNAFMHIFIYLSVNAYVHFSTFYSHYAKLIMHAITGNRFHF